MWHDASPWKRKRDKLRKPQTVDQALDDIERRCRAGDLSLRGAIDAARMIGILEAQGRQTAATAKG